MPSSLPTVHLPAQAPAGASLIAARGLRAAADRNMDAGGGQAPSCQPMQAGGGQRHAPEHIQNDEVNLMLSYLGDHAATGQGGAHVSADPVLMLLLGMCPGASVCSATSVCRLYV